MTEAALLDRIIEAIGADQDMARPIIHLSMVIDPELKQQDKTDIFHPFWRYNSLEVPEVRKITESSISLLKKNSK